MSIPGFTKSDFETFEIPGLEPRMEVLIERIRPKLTFIGVELAPFLSALCGEDMHFHVAKHARRSVNPPNDTWVAWSNNKRGYKAQPHFQVGLWSTHLFIQFAIIYECTHKKNFARQLDKQWTSFKTQLPDHFVWSFDHTKPDTIVHHELKTKDLKAATSRLRQVNKAELLCGLILPNDHPDVSQGSQLLAHIERTFAELLPLYRMAFD